MVYIIIIKLCGSRQYRAVDPPCRERRTDIANFDSRVMIERGRRRRRCSSRACHAQCVTRNRIHYYYIGLGTYNSYIVICKYTPIVRGQIKRETTTTETIIL